LKIADRYIGRLFDKMHNWSEAASPEKPVTILHVAESFAGGTLTSISKLTRGLGTPFRHVVLHGMREDTDPDYASRFTPDVELVRWRISKSIGRSFLAARAHLGESIARYAPEIVHAHSSKAGVIVRLSSAWRRTRVLYSPRGYSFQRMDVAPAVRAAFWLAEAMLARPPHLTIACGENEYRLARKLTPSVARINNMVNLAEIGTIRSNTNGGGPLRVAMMGQIAPAKNFPLLAEVALHCPTMRFTWIGGGDVPAGVILPPNLEIAGMLAHSEAIKRLAQQQVYIHTSRWEGLSNAVLEAMALGLPMVVSPASEEVVCPDSDLRNGYVCTTREDYVTVLRNYAQNPDVAKRHGLNSRKLVEGRYALDVVLAQWRELYLREAGCI
jgi:glycosyltransferase involved in cell wall biosynthesis